MPKIPEPVLEWRERQKPGAIMSPETFKRIVEMARRRGARDPYAVAGFAYWQTVLAKYRKRKKRREALRKLAKRRR